MLNTIDTLSYHLIAIKRALLANNSGEADLILLEIEKEYNILKEYFKKPYTLTEPPVPPLLVKKWGKKWGIYDNRDRLVGVKTYKNGKAVLFNTREQATSSLHQIEETVLVGESWLEDF